LVPEGGYPYPTARDCCVTILYFVFIRHRSVCSPNESSLSLRADSWNPRMCSDYQAFIGSKSHPVLVHLTQSSFDVLDIFRSPSPKTLSHFFSGFLIVFKKNISPATLPS